MTAARCDVGFRRERKYFLRNKQNSCLAHRRIKEISKNNDAKVDKNLC
jgi:hypothetical protein